MARDNTRYQAYNVRDSFEQPEDVAEYFSLVAPPESKIWRGRRDEFSAPMLLTSLVQKFQVIEVTVSAPFKVVQDQAGIVLFFDMSPDEPWIGPTSLEGRRRRRSNADREHTGCWAKAGLQQTEDGLLAFATVVVRPGCGPDQSISTVPVDLSDRYGFHSHQASLRIKLERVNDALWVSYRVLEAFSGEFRTPDEVNLQWTRAREVAGFFSGVTAKSRVMVGCYASRPLGGSEDEWSSSDLVAEFEDLELLETL